MIEETLCIVFEQSDLLKKQFMKEIYDSLFFVSRSDQGLVILNCQHSNSFAIKFGTLCVLRVPITYFERLPVALKLEVFRGQLKDLS